MTKAEALERSRRRAITLANTFAGPNGQDTLRLLEEEFGGDPYVKGDPHGTHIRVGEQRVLLFIKNMLRYAERGGDEHGRDSADSGI